MREERPKGLLDQMEDLEARRKKGTKGKKKDAPKDDDLDLGKVW